jgi:hypothetical protein
MDIVLTEKEDPRALIKKHIRENMITEAALARRIGLSPQGLWGILAQKRRLKESTRQKINEALKTNF